MVGGLPSSTYSFPLCFIINLDHALVGTSTNMSRESSSMSKNPPLIGADKKSIGYSSTSTNCSTLSTTFVVFFSTCFSSLESLVITDAGARSEKCLQKPRNVSLSPSPTITTHVNASKISHSMFLPSLELSLIF